MILRYIIMNLYPIEGTLNLHKEQLRGAYLDRSFWPNFQTTVEDYKSLLIKNVEQKIPFSVLRIGHSEMTAFYIGLKSNKKHIGSFIGRQSRSGEVPDDLLVKMFESIIETNYISTQIGYDFKKWINEVLKFVDYYKLIKTDNKPNIRKNFITHSFPDKDIKQLIDIPLDIIYGLIANKWIFKTFKNNIGLIGAGEKLRIIKKLMSYKTYQDYLGTDYFTDYIEIPQRGACDDERLEMDVIKGIQNSSCGIFLIGAGVSKLKFFHLLKKTKNGVYIDIGHGIDLIAGYGENTRPYCGTWNNYRLNSLNSPGLNQDLAVDVMGARHTPIIYLD